MTTVTTRRALPSSTFSNAAIIVMPHALNIQNNACFTLAHGNN